MYLIVRLEDKTYTVVMRSRGNRSSCLRFEYGILRHPTLMITIYTAVLSSIISINREALNGVRIHRWCHIIHSAKQTLLERCWRYLLRFLSSFFLVRSSSCHWSERYHHTAATIWLYSLQYFSDIHRCFTANNNTNWNWSVLCSANEVSSIIDTHQGELPWQLYRQ